MTAVQKTKKPSVQTQQQAEPKIVAAQNTRQIEEVLRWYHLAWNYISEITKTTDGLEVTSNSTNRGRV